MQANYHVEAGDLRVIRPLVYARERLTRDYARAADLPVIFENCPACFEAPKERARTKLLLASQEHLHPALFACLLQAMRPLMAQENSKLLGNPPQRTNARLSNDDDDDDVVMPNGSKSGSNSETVGPASTVVTLSDPAANNDTTANNLNANLRADRQWKGGHGQGRRGGDRQHDDISSDAVCNSANRPKSKKPRIDHEKEKSSLESSENI